ncbi:MAG TPA: DUF3037 domain-containing protein [Jatrophihabitans sp.]|nr:DUF3037 domain-containing protein [Jatrophihabitans sp.]
MTSQATTVARLPFQYVVLRCVPRVDREEFLNVGVVLYCQAAEYLACASHVEEQRLLTLAPDLDVAAVRSALDGIAEICAGTGPSAFINLGQRFGWLAAPKSTMIQPGPVHGGLAEDPQAELAHLLDMLVR